MPWLNIRQNLTGEVKRFFSFSGNLYAIVDPGSSTYRIFKLDAARAGASWATDTLWLAVAPNSEYNITGAVEDLSNNYMYVANAAHGEVYINRSKNFVNVANWETTTGPFAGYIGTQAILRELVYYNRRVYLAHRGGVSYYNAEQDVDEWQLVANFTENPEGIGECSGMTVLEGVLYVIVSFDTLYAVYKYDAQQETLRWEKFAEYPRDIVDSDYSSKARYITSRNNVIFTTDYGIGLNVFNSRGIDTTLTDQPRFTQGTHLDGAPSSIITYNERSIDYVFITCWDQDFSGQESSAFGDNLIKTIEVEDVSVQQPGETWFTDFDPQVDTDGASVTSTPNGSFRFSKIVAVTELTNLNSFRIDFHIKTNELTLLPGETYTIIWEQAAKGNATKLFGKDPINAGASVQIGFSNIDGDDIDSESPNKTLSILGELFVLRGSEYERVTFTFNANDVNTDTTDGTIYIKGLVAAKLTVPQLLSGEYKQFSAYADIRNIQLFRGSADDANATYLESEYIIKEYTDIPTVENDNHIIEAPSPPDQWFIKFSRNADLSIIEEVSRFSRRVLTNKMTLQPDQNYKLHFVVKKASDGIPEKTYRVRTISPVSGIAELSATCQGTEQRSFQWEFPTSGIAASDLEDLQFTIEVWEEDIAPGNGATFYISDINIQRKIAETARNTVYRYDGQAWDDVQTRESSDGGIVSGSGQPFGLHQEFEVNSDAARLYCIANQDPYVWSIGLDDPFGGEIVPRIVITWDSSDQ